MTRKEASKKLCPFISGPSNNGVDSFIETFDCVCDNCMAWVWDSKNIMVDTSEGHCSKLMNDKG